MRSGHPMIRRHFSPAAPDRDDQCTELRVQETSQRLAAVTLGLFGHLGIHCLIEAVIRAWVYVELDRHAGAAQAVRVGHALLQEAFKAATRDVGWRQA